MTIRKMLEEREAIILSPKAAWSAKSRGRKVPVAECTFRTAYQRDRDRIIHSKAFRRLKHKTQVFIAPTGDHYRTRLTHTLEVAQIARTIARALRLNEDLVEAIALGHDLGHTPFGHAGEEVLNRCYARGFRHHEQSLRVVDVLENLNLTYEVRDGILHHTWEGKPCTLEGQVIKLADRIAYINHDIDDAIRAKVLKFTDLPKAAISVLGRKHGQRIDTMVGDIIKNSDRSIKMSPKVAKATETLHAFMFNRVYLGEARNQYQGKTKRIEIMLTMLFDYFLKHPADIGIKARLSKARKEREVVDFIAGMTDPFAIALFKELFLPKGWEE